VGEEQIAIARDMTKRVVLGCDGKWEELVGAFREDGSKYVSSCRNRHGMSDAKFDAQQPGLIEHNLPLLALRSTEDYHALILRPAAEQCASEHRLLEAIKLYNLAGEHTTVIQTLTRALGDSLAEPDGNGEEGRALENLARTILEHYSRRGEVSGRQREELVRLLKIREAMEAYDKHRFEAALDVRHHQCSPLPSTILLILRRLSKRRTYFHYETIANLAYIVLLKSSRSAMRQSRGTWVTSSFSR
jgi:nuclear pore complex protein Nup93